MIFATFINRHYAPDEIEMVHAWDEYSRDDNPEGYQETQLAALNSVKPDILNCVVVQVVVDDNRIRELLNPETPVLQGEIK